MLSGPLTILNVHVLSSKLICEGFLRSVRVNILSGLIAPGTWHKVRHTEDYSLILINWSSLWPRIAVHLRSGLPEAPAGSSLFEMWPLEALVGAYGSETRKDGRDNR